MVDHADSPEHADAEGPASSSSCAVCAAKLGKRHFRPRHHCRICNRCVCGMCSPSLVRLHAQQQVQRACSECVEKVVHGEVVKTRVHQLAMQLQGVAAHWQSTSREAPGEGDIRTVAETLQDAVSLCEQSLLPLQDMCAKVAEVQARIDAADPDLKMIFVCSQPTDVETDASLRQSMDSLDSSTQSIEAVLRVSKRSLAFGNRSRVSLAGHSTVATLAGVSELQSETPQSDTADQQWDRQQSDSSSSNSSADPASSPERSGRNQETFAAECSLCNGEFSPHGGRRRDQVIATLLKDPTPHHCRICRRCICSNCSSPKVKFASEKDLQVVCTGCIQHSVEAHALRPKLVQLGNALMSCAGMLSDLDVTAEIATAISASETTVVPLEAIRNRLRDLKRHDRRMMVEKERRRKQALAKAAGPHIFSSGRATDALLIPDLNSSDLLRSWSEHDSLVAVDDANRPRSRRLCFLCAIM